MSLPNDEFYEDRLSGKKHLMLTVRGKGCEFKSTTES